MENRIQTYCAMSKSRCGVIATVKDGRFVRLEPDSAHPNRGICIKGQAAPELVYDALRLRYPLRRTTPKSSDDPGWERVSWDEALDEIAGRLEDLRAQHGAESVFFYRGASGGSATAEYEPWMIRLASLFGTPNTVSTGHICSWHKDNGSRYTYGMGIPSPDFEQTSCILLWGHNPNASWPTQAIRISAARKRGAKLIVIDPRAIPLTKKADVWLKIRPGTDGLLALSFLHVMIEEKLYDDAFLRKWTNAGFLVADGDQRLIRESDFRAGGRSDCYAVWDVGSKAIAFHDPQLGVTGDIEPDMTGTHELQLSDGEIVSARPVWQAFTEHIGAYSPEVTADTTGIEPDLVRQAVRLFCKTKPACYYSYNGLEQHANAMQTNRAVCIFYSLTGNLEQPGGNVRFPKNSVNQVDGREFLTAEQTEKRLGLDKRPLGPVATGRVQAYEVYQAVLSSQPYPVKGFMSFGGDIIMANGNTLEGRRALQKLDLYVQTDFYETPAGQYADFLLPAATSWEGWNVKASFDQGLLTSTYLQYREPVIPPQFECRPDVDVIFQLASRLGFDSDFWDGNLEAACDYMLKPTGFTVASLKSHPGGIALPKKARYRKYEQEGFATKSGLVELFSVPFREHGYPPMPTFVPGHGLFGAGTLARYPFTLTTAKAINYCHGQHRSLPSLRAKTPEPLAEIHPKDAAAQGIEDKTSVRIETKMSAITLIASLNPEIPRGVVRLMHGWWQECPDLDLPGYDPFTGAGANVNLIIDNDVIDPITGSVPHRSYPCRISATQAGSS